MRPDKGKRVSYNAVAKVPSRRHLIKKSVVPARRHFSHSKVVLRPDRSPILYLRHHPDGTVP